MKPLLLLDIDGVLIPFGGRLPKDCEMIILPWGQMVPGSPAMRGRLAKLREVYEMHWATMWQGDANSVVGPWHSLPALPFVNFIDWEAEEFSYEMQEVSMFVQAASHATYKMAAIAKYIGDRPMAWIDDHIFEDGFDWAKKRADKGIPTLLLRTNPGEGMTDLDMERLLEFAKAIKSGHHVPTKDGHTLT